MDLDRPYQPFQEIRIQLIIAWKMWQLFYESAQKDGNISVKSNPNYNVAPVMDLRRQKPFTQTPIGLISRRSMRRQHPDGK